MRYESTTMVNALTAFDKQVEACVCVCDVLYSGCEYVCCLPSSHPASPLAHAILNIFLIHFGGRHCCSGLFSDFSRQTNSVSQFCLLLWCPSCYIALR